MKALDCLWADRYRLVKFFKDAPGMDIWARQNYFHDVFPYAELLPVNFYLTDAKDVNIACNKTTLQMLGDQSITDYFGYHLHEYSIRKGWPRKISEIQIENNHAALLNNQGIICQEFTMRGDDEIKWSSKKHAIYDDNGLAVGLVGVSIVIGSSSKTIHWDCETERIAISFSGNHVVELSKREFYVLQGMLNGSTAEDIASKENISNKTVETYMMRLKIKLKCYRLRDVISLCIKNDLAKNILEFRYDFIKH